MILPRLDYLDLFTYCIMGMLLRHMNKVHPVLAVGELFLRR